MLPYSKKYKRTTGYRSNRFYIKSFIFILFPIVNVLISFLLKAPGCERGYLGPGTNSVENSMKDCAGGANLYIDQLVFGKARVSTYPKCRHIYGCSTFDEDGLLGTLNFIYGVYLGSVIGEFYLQKRKMFSGFGKHMVGHVLAYGSAGIVIGALPSISTIKINSQLWSLSFVFVSHAASAIIFSAVMALSVYKSWSGWPFKAVGKNGIFILVFQEIMKDRFPFGYIHNGNHFDSMFSSLLNCTVWIGLAILLHGYKFYIKY